MTLTQKLDALRQLLASQAGDLSADLRRIDQKIDYLSQQRHKLAQKLSRFPDAEELSTLDYLSLVSLAESFTIVPDDLLIEDDTERAQALADHRQQDPHCSCNSCIEYEANQAIQSHADDYNPNDAPDYPPLRCHARNHIDERCALTRGHLGRCDFPHAIDTYTGQPLR